MRSFILLMVLLMFTVSGCAAIDYFKRPENQATLMELGVDCFQGKNYTIGVEYGLTRDGQQITNAMQVGGIIGCDNKKFSVICDVTKGPDENPCSDVRSYTEDTPPNKPEPEPAPVPEVKAEPTPVAAPTPVKPEASVL